MNDNEMKRIELAWFCYKLATRRLMSRAANFEYLPDRVQKHYLRMADAALAIGSFGS